MCRAQSSVITLQAHSRGTWEEVWQDPSALRLIAQIFKCDGSNKETRRGLYSKLKFYKNGYKNYKLL